MKKIIVMLLALVALCSCQKEEFEGFDMPFVKVTTTTGASQTVVLSNVNNINTYVVSVSSKMLTTALVVNYEIVVGDGLQEGVDYELVTTGNQLTFGSGGVGSTPPLPRPGCARAWGSGSTWASGRSIFSPPVGVVSAWAFSRPRASASPR